MNQLTNSDNTVQDTTPIIVPFKAPLIVLFFSYILLEITTKAALKIKSATSPTPAVIVAGNLTTKRIKITKNPAYGP